MKKFTGFTDQETFTKLPDSFFRSVLPDVDDAEELKVTLYALWRLEHMEARVRYLRLEDFCACLAEPAAAVEKAVQRGTLLQAAPLEEGTRDAAALYFLNTPRGRAAAQGYREGRWNPATTSSMPPAEVPNIFRLYEENIGPLTPLLADALKEAEKTYPPEWIGEAVEISVKYNKRSWHYIESILKRWKEEGHAQEQDRRNLEGPRGRDVARKVDDFLKR
jgi:DnaD/phage-associated family protein